jgi:hypothetical protein
MKKLFNISVYIVFIFALLSSCQIEKRHYLNGYFVGNIASVQKLSTSHNQLIDTSERVSLVVPLFVEQLQGGKLENPEIADSLKEGDYLGMGSSFDEKRNCQFEKCFVSKTTSVTIPFRGRDLLIQKVAPANYSKKKIHPYSILGLVLLMLSVSSYLVFCFFGVPGILLLMCLLFFMMSIIAFIIARKKTLQNPDVWSGIVMVNTLLTIEIILLLIVTLGFIIAFYLLF